MNNWKTIIMSDLHLGARQSQTDKIISFLDNNTTEKLILNGDIIDGWALKGNGKWTKDCTKIFRRFMKMSEKNTKVIYIRGNHDDFLKDFIPFKLNNIRIVRKYIHTGIDNRKYFCFHGDVLDVFSSKFKIIAKIGSIGYDFALWLNRIYNKYRELRKLPYYSISNDIKQGVKAAVNFVGDFEKNAVVLAKQKKCDVAVCGHIHKSELTSSYMNSGDWCENCTALVEDYEGKWTIINFHL